MKNGVLVGAVGRVVCRVAPRSGVLALLLAGRQKYERRTTVRDRRLPSWPKVPLPLPTVRAGHKLARRAGLGAGEAPTYSPLVLGGHW